MAINWEKTDNCVHLVRYDLFTAEHNGKTLVIFENLNQDAIYGEVDGVLVDKVEFDFNRTKHINQMKKKLGDFVA